VEGKAAALGGADFVRAFSALGLDTFAVETTLRSVTAAAEQIVRGQYSLVVVAENVASLAQSVFEPTLRKALPCVVVVPFLEASTGAATEALGRALKLATGINILAG